MKTKTYALTAIALGIASAGAYAQNLGSLASPVTTHLMQQGSSAGPTSQARAGNSSMGNRNAMQEPQLGSSNSSSENSGDSDSNGQNGSEENPGSMMSQTLEGLGDMPGSMNISFRGASIKVEGLSASGGNGSTDDGSSPSLAELPQPSDAESGNSGSEMAEGESEGDDSTPPNSPSDVAESAPEPESPDEIAGGDDDSDQGPNSGDSGSLEESDSDQTASASGSGSASTMN